MQLPAVPAENTAPDLAPAVRERIARAAARAHSPATQRAYDSAWRRFSTWCRTRDYCDLPAHPATVAAYLVDAADTLDQDGKRAYSPATLTKWLAAIGDRHRVTGADPALTLHPLVRDTLAGIKREYADAGDRPRVPRTPLVTEDVMALVSAARAQAVGWAAGVYERRDTAILLLGLTGAFRRDELVSLTGEDVAWHAGDGLHVHVRRSKTDQEGRGLVHAIPRFEYPDRCPACAVIRWTQVVTAFDSGGRTAVIRLVSQARPADAEHTCLRRPDSVAAGRPVLRAIRQNGNLSHSRLSGASVHAVVRRRAELAGFPPEVVERLGAHSLRAGFVTQAARSGADALAIMRQTGHRTPAMVVRYVRESSPLVGNAVTELGL